MPFYQQAPPFDGFYNSNNYPSFDNNYSKNEAQNQQTYNPPFYNQNNNNNNNNNRNVQRDSEWVSIFLNFF